MTSIGTWNPAPISDRHLEDIERGMTSAHLPGYLTGVGEWEIHGVIARLRAAEAYLAILERYSEPRIPMHEARSNWLASKTGPAGPGGMSLRMEDPVMRRPYLEMTPAYRVLRIFHPKPIRNQPLFGHPQLQQPVNICDVRGLPKEMRRVRRPSDGGVMRWTPIPRVHLHRPTPSVPDALEGIQQLLAHYPGAKAAMAAIKLADLEVVRVHRGHSSLPKNISPASLPG